MFSTLCGFGIKLAPPAIGVPNPKTLKRLDLTSGAARLSENSAFSDTGQRATNRNERDPEQGKRKATRSDQVLITKDLGFGQQIAPSARWGPLPGVAALAGGRSPHTRLDTRRRLRDNRKCVTHAVTGPSV